MVLDPSLLYSLYVLHIVEFGLKILVQLNLFQYKAITSLLVYDPSRLLKLFKYNPMNIFGMS